ncbi:MAG: FxsA family protein, partial [Gemmatimonadetes bacterium]|nr:FxsA family protein [Gemmatimonadota bacterium]
RVFFQFRQSIAQAQIPGQAVLDGLSVRIGGAFLVTPGVLTDVLGFSLLLPLSRHWIQRRIRSRLEQKIKDGTIHVVSMRPGHGFGAGFSGSTNSNSWTPKAGNPEVEEGAQPRRTSKNEIIFEPEEQ